MFVHCECELLCYIDLWIWLGNTSSHLCKRMYPSVRPSHTSCSVCRLRCASCVLFWRETCFLSRLYYCLRFNQHLFRCGGFVSYAFRGAPFASSWEKSCLSSCLDYCLDHCLYSDAGDSFRMPLEVRLLHPLALTTALTIAFIQMRVIRSGCRRRCAFCILCLQVKWTKSKLKLGCTRIWSSELKRNKLSEKMESQVTFALYKYCICTVYMYGHHHHHHHVINGDIWWHLLPPGYKWW